MLIRHEYKASTILHLSDVAIKKRYFNQSGRGLYLSLGTLYEEEILNIPSSDTNKQKFDEVLVQ